MREYGDQRVVFQNLHTAVRYGWRFFHVRSRFTAPFLISERKNDDIQLLLWLSVRELLFLSYPSAPHHGSHIQKAVLGGEAQLFVDELLRFASVTELDEIVTHRLIEKIVIGEPYEENGETIQKVQIVHNFVGAISE